MAAYDEKRMKMHANYEIAKSATNWWPRYVINYNELD